MIRNPRSTVLSAFFLICLFLIQPSMGQAGPTPRIINGNPASTSNYPWMASLSIASTDGEFESGCGGSLISSTWVLTAAHCFLNESGDAVDATAEQRTTVILNSDTLDPPGENVLQANAKRVIVHPGYNPDPTTSANANDFDMALVELDSAVELKVVQLMSATGPELPTGTETIVMGWGATGVDADNNTIDPSNDLLQAQQKTVSDSSCADLYGGDITENMLCAGAVDEGGNTDTCKGDSGGPMVVDTASGMIQVGVVSFGGTEEGPACGDPDAPGVYARVSRLNSFITEYVPDAVFSDISSPEPSCEGNALNSKNDLAISCLIAGEQSAAVNLALTDPSAFIWQWDGIAGASDCMDQQERCATLSEDFTLTVPGIALGDALYTLQLSFLPKGVANGEYAWQYLDHFEE